MEVNQGKESNPEKTIIISKGTTQYGVIWEILSNSLLNEAKRDVGSSGRIKLWTKLGRPKSHAK